MINDFINIANIYFINRRHDYTGSDISQNFLSLDNLLYSVKEIYELL